MNLSKKLREIFGKERFKASEAQRRAQEIAFAPVAFQVSRMMLKYNILSILTERKSGMTLTEIVDGCKLSPYAVKVLLEASLSIGTIILKSDRFFISKTGWFLLHDPMSKINMDFNHDVNYQGLYYLEESLLSGRPEGLKVFGSWPTIYEGLSQLPKQVQDSWFAFDHFYSDHSFDSALPHIFSEKNGVQKILDVGGNTGRWALRCVEYDPSVEVTILDLPKQLEFMRNHVYGKKGSERISGYACDLLDPHAAFPDISYDVILMSQFLDCFSEEEILSICQRVSKAMKKNTRLCIMETFWDRQMRETAAYCISLTSPYFTAMANGNSKMYHSDDMKAIVEKAGLQVMEMKDDLGLGHTLMICRIK